MQPSLVLRNKLQRPAVPRDLVARPRLAQRFALATGPGVTLVCAPAGFGKTTFLAAWLREVSLPTAWLTLDEHDSSLTHFLHYLVAAIQDLFPGACPRTLSLVSSLHPCEPDEAAATFLSEIEVLPRHFMLVLDDYHRICQEAVHRFMADLVANLPQQMRLVIAGREDPPLPLARVRACGQLTEVRGEHLCFNRDETQTFLTRAVGGTISSETMAALEEKTEGWIAGLRLAALSLRDTDDPAAFTRSLAGTHRDLASYLVEEVLARQPVDIQEFLLRTSVLDRLCPALCDFLLEGIQPPGRSEEVLAIMEQRNLFLVVLDAGLGWYRYHHLFQDLLRSRLSLWLSAAEIAELHRRAAGWLARYGHVDEALNHAHVAGDEQTCVHLVETNLRAVVNNEQWPILRRWLDRLPAPAKRERPALLLARAWLLNAQHRLADVAALVDRAAIGIEDRALCLPESEREALLGAIETFRSQDCYFRGEYRRSLEHSLSASARLPTDEWFLRGCALVFQVLSGHALGQHDRALQVIDEALAHEGTTPPTYTSRVLLAQAVLFEQSGQLEGLAEAGRRCLRCATRRGLPLSTVWAHHWLGYVHFEWNDLDDAAGHFRAAIKLRRSAQAISLFDCYVGEALTFQAQGQSDALQETLGELQAFAEANGISAFLAATRSLRARLSLDQGDLESAERWLAEAPTILPVGPMLWFEVPQITRVRVLLAQGREASVNAALDTLRACLKKTENSHDTRRVIEILALQAVALDALGRSAEALRWLERAVSLAWPGGFVRSFIDAGPRMPLLLRRLAEHDIRPGYINRLLAAFSEVAETAGDNAMSLRTVGRIDIAERGSAGLTRREREVLRLLAGRLTDKEIADYLVVSLFTVKRHTSSVYSKLGVSGRRQAVAQARALGLLSPT